MYSLNMINLKNALKSAFVPEEKNNFLPQILGRRPLFWYGVAILVVKIAVFSLILILPATNFFSAISSQRLLDLINGVRQEQNLSPLALNNKLTSAAELKTANMLDNNYFEHTSPTGVTPWHWFKLAGYNFAWAGENLAMDFFDTDKVFQAWMNSPAHRDNILNPRFQEIGIAVKEGEINQHFTTLAVLTFGSQQKSAQKSAVAAGPSKTPVSEPSKTPEPTKITTPIPSNPAPSAPMQSQIPLKVAGNTATPLPEISSLPQTALNNARIPRVLGIFTSQLEEILKSLYLYFTLFLIAALAINIFIKIRIQHWPTIFATTFLIILSGILIIL